MSQSKETPLYESQFEINQGTRTVPVFTTAPRAEEPLPGLIVVHEIFGVNDHIRDVARRFAREGLRVYAPDLFTGPNVPDNRDDLDAMRKVWSDIPDAQLIGDLKAVLNHAIKQGEVKPTQVGAIGYCMGGAIAFMFACETPEIACIADYYGRIYYPQLTEKKPKHPIDYAFGLNGSFLGLFAGQDELITADHISKFTEKLQQYGKTFQLKVYEDAPHAFFNDQRPNYNRHAAEDAWSLTIAFFKRHLLQSSASVV